MKTNNTTTTSNVFQIVTKQILDRLMKGEIPWRDIFLPRKDEKPRYRNHFSGTGYSLLNAMLLGEPGAYATWNQIKEHGGNVKAGAKSKIVTYWCRFVPKDKKAEYDKLIEEGKDASHLEMQTLKYYHVFNLKDVEGLTVEDEQQIAVTTQKACNPTDIADMVITEYRTNQNIAIETTGVQEAGYNPATDSLCVPDKERFLYEEDWYATVMGGLVHSTAKQTRCDRKSEFEKMTEGEVSVKEDLTAEIGSSMILNSCGLIREETHEQITAQIQRYIEAMNRDYRLIIYASSGAEKAARYILGDFA